MLSNKFISLLYISSVKYFLQSFNHPTTLSFLLGKSPCLISIPCIFFKILVHFFAKSSKLSSVLIESTDEKEERADRFAFNMMIDEEKWRLILDSDLTEKSLLEISRKNNIPMCYIVGRLAKLKKIAYGSKLYNKYDVIKSA